MGLDQPAVVVVLTIVTLVVLKLLLFLVLTGGDTGRIWFAIRAFIRMLRDPTFTEKVRLVLEPPPPPPPPKPSAAPLRLLRLLQRDGRFLDFVLEDVAEAQDDQIAAAVREMQPRWRAVLREHLDIVPVRPESEDTAVEVPPGFDPSAIQLTGNVTGQPPFRGTLKHPGWRVKEMKIPTPPEGQDEFVIQPAEVELP
jgi:Domain of unknown function (DUF2760)